MKKKELLEYFVDRDILELYADFSDDGDGELELTDCGNDVAELIIELIDKVREEGIREAVEEAYEYGRDSIRLPMSLTKEQVIDKLLK